MKRLGKQTVRLQNPPSILGFAATVGKKEGQGPLAPYFDMVEPDSYFGEDSWEKAETKMMEMTFSKAVEKAGLTTADLDYALSGDLLNQCISSAFGMRQMQIPYFGLYGACSTMAESLSIGAMLIDGDFAKCVLCGTGSHFCSAERQYRLPLEYGGQRTPTAQWTVTGSGAAVLGQQGKPPYITHLTTGKIVDLGVNDANNMGAAMAPAFCDTLKAHFQDTGRTPADYDLIVSGDLGRVGMALVLDMCRTDGIVLDGVYDDCGCMIFSPEQDTHAGGSGCGCSASVLCGYLLKELQSGRYRNLLFMATGALMSPTSSMQGETIPGICHAVAISSTMQ